MTTLLTPKIRTPKATFLSATALVCVSVLLNTGCSPRIEVAVPQEPITINLNVKIEHQIQVKVDREIDELFQENSDLF